MQSSLLDSGGNKGKNDELLNVRLQKLTAKSQNELEAH